MASPQIENGYTKISNELIDQFCKYRLSGEEWLILWVIIRKTYGFKKLMDSISLTQFSQITGMKKQSVHRALKSLSAKMLIAVSKIADRKIINYGLQKNYEKWILCSKKNTISKIADKPISKIADKPISKIADELSAILLPTKESIKETLKQYDFESLWGKYPKKDGRRAAERHFRASVKTDQDWRDINTAIDNYLDYIKNAKVEKQYIKNGSTFFNNWRDWITPPMEPIKRARGLTPDEMQEMH